MATCSIVLLALPFMILAVTQGCRGELDPKASVELVSGLKGIAHSLECFRNILGESLVLQKANRDVLQESLLVQREHSESLLAVSRLTDLFKEQLGQQNEVINSLSGRLGAFHKVEIFSRENEELKTQLSSETSKVEDLQKQLKASAKQVSEHSEKIELLNHTVEKLQDSLLAAGVENYQNILKVQNLEHRLVAAENENEQIILKVQDLNKKLNDSKETIEELEEKLKVVENPVDNPDKKGEDTCNLAGGDTIRNVMQEFNRTQDWRVARTGLEGVLDKSSAAYKQLQDIAYHDSVPLYWVGRGGSTELAEVLVTCGQAVNMADSEGRTMLFGVAYKGDVELARWLVEHGADMEAGYTGGWTVLMNAAGVGNLELVKYLVGAGAITTAKDDEGQTALDLARSNHRDDVVQYLSQLAH